jgi:hypothetical protein
MSYLEDVIRKGDLASLDMSTLRDLTKDFPGEDIRKIGSEYLLFPNDAMIAAIPIAGDPSIMEAEESASVFIDDAAEFAMQRGWRPIALTDILEMSAIDNKVVIPLVKKGLYDAAKRHGIWIANGEIAGHGDRVTVPFNISGLLLAYAPNMSYGVHRVGGRQIACFNSKKGLFLNSDGNGTKPEWNERLYDLGKAFARIMAQDGFSMRWDDTVKMNANVIFDHTRLELGKDDTNIIRLMQYAISKAAQRYGIQCILDVEITDRISGYGIPMSSCGSSVSEVDPVMLAALPVPKAGQAVLGLYNAHNRNLRCNGITDNRKVLSIISSGGCFKMIWSVKSGISAAARMTGSSRNSSASTGLEQNSAWKGMDSLRRNILSSCRWIQYPAHSSRYARSNHTGLKHGS